MDQTFIDGQNNPINAPLGSPVLFNPQGGIVFSIQNLTFKNYISWYGGTIIHASGQDTKIYLTNVKIENCVASRFGGAIAITAGAVYYGEGNYFVENAQPLGFGKGGAIYIVSGGEYYGINERFIGNTAAMYGGAIYANGGILNLTDCQFQSNAASYSPGGIINFEGLEGNYVNANPTYVSETNSEPYEVVTYY